jgi:hypothetical protein
MEIPGARLQAIFSNLFDALHPNLFPLPFDDFYTARGKAASNCRLFTTELFRGNLNQSWISARNVREKNRAGRLLNESWQIFESDGTVREKTKNAKVRHIIDSIDSKLKEKDSVNLGEIVQMLCKPPYGCNIASAGLVLGVFVAARKDRLRFKLRDDNVFIDNWLAKSFERDLLDLSVLEDNWLRYISDNRMSRWQALLNEWDIEKSYEGQVGFLQKAQQLNKEELVPDGVYYRWELLQRQSLEAQEAVKEWRDTLQNQELLIERTCQRKMADHSARCSAELSKLLKSMTAHRDCWTERQIEITQKVLSQALQNTKELFPEWLPKQGIADPTELSGFKMKISEVRQNLVAVGLEEQARRLQERVDKVGSEIDRIIKIKGIIGTVKSFVQGHPISAGTRVNEICSCLETIPDLRKTLKDSVGEIELPHLDEALASLNSLEGKCREQMQTYELRVKELWNGGLRSIQHVIGTAQEVRSLCTIYDGRETELKIFQLMLKFLSLLEENYGRLASLSLSEDEFHHAYGELLNDEKAVLCDGGELPWNIEETCQGLLCEIDAKRRDHASSWMRTNVPRISDIQLINAGLVQRLRGFLQSPPAVLSQEQLMIVRDALDACVSRLDDMEVEGLLVRFKDLSREAQAEFLERAKRLVVAG